MSYSKHEQVILLVEYFEADKCLVDNKRLKANLYGGKPFYVTGVHGRSDVETTYDIRRSEVEFFLVEEKFLTRWDTASMGKPRF